LAKKPYSDWLREFTFGKREVPASPSNDQYGVRDLRRYVNKQGEVWETAVTYTGRLVLRSGTIGKDGISIEWQSWITEHDIELPPDVIN